MKLFLDTANIDEVREAAELGILSGVTTNPTLASKERMEFRALIKEICSIVKGPVSAECVGKTRDEMLDEARSLAEIDEHVVVKMPMGEEGVAACAKASAEGIKVNMTLVFSPNQAILAAEAGAYYCSPFLGRLDDIGWHGLDLLAEIVEIYDVQGYNTDVLAASLRHPLHVTEAAKIGADIATMPFEVFKKMFRHPLTDIGEERFLRDWEKYRQAVTGA